MSKMYKIIFLTLLAVLAISSAGFASSYLTKIEVNLEPIQLAVNDSLVEGNYFNNGEEELPRTMIYKGTTYMSVKDLSEILDMNIQWEGESRTISLSEKDPVPVDNEINLSFKVLEDHELTEDQRAFVQEVKMEQGVYSKDNLFVIARGEVPNPGYGIEYVKQEQLWEQLKVYVKLTEPKQDMMYPQVISYPYIVGTVDLPNYTTISFINADTGEELFRQEQLNRK